MTGHEHHVDEEEEKFGGEEIALKVLTEEEQQPVEAKTRGLPLQGIPRAVAI